jgi:lipoprotein LprG
MIRRLLACVLLGWALASCSGGVAAPTPSPTPTPADLVARAGSATQASKSLHFAIELTGKPVYSDAAHLFAIRSITGDIQRPDGALAALKVRGALGVAEIRTASVGGQQYFTNPVTRQWQCLAPGTAFDPGVLFDAKQGIGVLLEQGIEGPALAGVESIDGRPFDRLRGTLPADRLQSISAGLLGAGPVAIELWADQEHGRISKIVLVDTATDAAEPTTWTMLISDYDKPVDVRAPAEC